jgi:hypothetical protein
MGRGGEDGWNQQRGAEGNRKRIEYGCVGIRQLSCMGMDGEHRGKEANVEKET